MLSGFMNRVWDGSIGIVAIVPRQYLLHGYHDPMIKAHIRPLLAVISQVYELSDLLMG